ncbi:TolC family outer membrane protein [Thiohalobacter thiocyanaticus]|uniref:Type I secretion protein TolC n=1 Tax=Thiohalobacter thiocyanaticus TaxID=585455 RepID=A0A426QIT0_9GAMM|nr:TolC family outer membrane protein [Thiohalobacter thiocyanaticus]RRQ21607.1 type I secretion protein TolC [Thiohalobacter thiocyanaticus]
MNAKRTLLATLMGGLLAGQPALALDLLGAYRIAADSDPTLRAAAANRDALLEADDQALARLLPNVGINGTYQRNRFDDRNTDQTSYSTDEVYTLSATQTLFRWDQFVALDQADSLVAQALANYSAAEQDLIIRLAEGYFNVLAAQDNLSFARAELEAIGRQLEQARERFEVGLIAITDVHEAQARYDLATSQEIVAENELDSAREALYEITGELNEPVNPLNDRMQLLYPEPRDTATWVDRALDNNLNLVALQAAVEAARQEVKRQRAGHYPTLDASAALTRRDQNFGGIAGVKRHDASIGLELNIPLFQGGAVNSLTREAHYRFIESQEQFDQVRRQTQRQTRDAYRGVASGIAQVRALEQALVSTETALEAAETGFEVGTRTIVDVLDAQRERFRAQRDLARARYDYLLSTLRLKQAAGSLGVDDLQAINTWFQ